MSGEGGGPSVAGEWGAGVCERELCNAATTTRARVQYLRHVVLVHIQIREHELQERMNDVSFVALVQRQQDCSAHGRPRRCATWQHTQDTPPSDCPVPSRTSQMREYRAGQCMNPQQTTGPANPSRKHSTRGRMSNQRGNIRANATEPPTMVMMLIMNRCCRGLTMLFRCLLMSMSDRTTDNTVVAPPSTHAW